ncbi:MAG: nucleoside deaminase [Flavobacteriales bacterium]|jgi:tRNA(adenine34) deaminase|nr:nucleoside deaminase [Flavobacteriales bacterium]MBT4478674.1 nucleoside deaminase [Flavobacteriales bacterium]MBT6814797.1 nucleoside deaminase [Flavobacteriales bacterium]MBT7619651.1 nucleoside deaminase [Flavobacteriales bacterium]MDG2059094.1 nucleoside deaminase [Flavobacteriales bacterium]
MEINPFSDEYFMTEALKEAEKAMILDEVPVGAIIVCDNQIIARAHNYTERLNDVTAHAEMQAFTSAADYLGGKYLNECTLYVTLEPCIMCGGASFWTQIKRIVYGASDEKRGFLSVKRSVLHPKTEVSKGIHEEKCSKILQEFFQHKRT